MSYYFFYKWCTFLEVAVAISIVARLGLLKGLCYLKKSKSDDQKIMYICFYF